MNITQQTFLNILAASIHKRKYEIEQQEKIDYDELYKLSVEHNVTSLLYYGISGSKAIEHIPKNILDMFKKQTVFSSMNQINHIKNLESIINEFKENNIKTVVLKGVVVRNFYPRPEFRTMGDADIVVKKTDLQASIDILERLGYKEKIRTNVDINYTKGNSVIELHWNLINQGRVNGGEQFENNIWYSLISVNVNETEALSLSYEDLAVHLFVHLIKHLADKGCGIRHFIDLVALLEAKEDEINWTSFWNKIGEYNLEKSTRVVLYICDKYLGMNTKYKVNYTDDINESYLSVLMDDILNHGVFGRSNEEESIARTLAFDKDKKYETNSIIRYIKVFFPPINDIQTSYQYCKKNVLLIPFAYIHRLIKWTISNDISVKSKASICIKGASVIKERSKIMKWLEI